MPRIFIEQVQILIRVQIWRSEFDNNSLREDKFHGSSI